MHKRLRVLTVTLNPCVDKTISLEGELAPGVSNYGSGAGDVAGGKGLNVARLLVKLGMPTIAIAPLGGRSGQLVADLAIGKDEVDLRPVWIADRTRTIVTVREQGSGRMTPLVEPNSRHDPGDAERLLTVFRQALPEVGMVILSGSSPQPCLDGCYRDMLALAKARGIYTILDTYGESLRLGLEAGPDLVKPNLAEAERWLGRRLPGPEEQRAAVKAFLVAGAGAVCLSLGREGALLVTGGRGWRFHSPRVRTVNPVGSGDCLVAGIAYGLARGWELWEATAYGVAAGAANAEVWEAAGFEISRISALRKRVKVE